MSATTDGDQISGRVIFPLMSGEPTPRMESVRLDVGFDQPFLPERIYIESARDWIVRDILIDGVSIMSAHAGGIAGDVFATKTIDDLIRFVPCSRSIGILAMCLGREEPGSMFKAAVIGSSYVSRPYPVAPSAAPVIAELRDEPTFDTLLGACADLA